MRTISGTVSTREEAEAARGRLEALGIERERILFKEVGEPGSGGAGIFVTAKVAPEQVEAASNILKGGGQERPPAPQPTVSAAPSPPPTADIDRSAMRAPAEPAAEPPARVERHYSSYTGARAAPATSPQPSSPRLGRIAAIAALLAGLGFAAGAALGILF